MNKILLIMGSPRVQGNTFALYSYFKGILDSRGIKYDFLEVGLEKNLHPCTHCKACYKIGHCFQKDSFSEVLSRFKSYEYVVWFTPIYFFQLPSQSKAFLDRLYSEQDWWDNKKFFVVAVSGSQGYFGGADVLEETFIRSSEYCGFEYLGMYNKVTNDEILGVNSEDSFALNSIVDAIKEGLQ